ncbi:hypothetical protein AX16_008264 [Volvariella volvacea WC 439]|nr:hypothetical protein AX16_008264 [Volvariella volvacea WC 439]
MLPHSLSTQQAYCIIIISGVGCHLAFKHVEPRSLSALGALLLAIPIWLSILLRPCFPNVLVSLGTTPPLYLSTLIASTVAYRLSPFHPLAKYPGPVICKVTKIWFAYVAWKGKQHLYVHDLHAKYGDIVRTGPNEISFASASLIQPLMGAHGLPKGPFWDGQFADQKSHRSLVGVRDLGVHSKLRKIWSRGFSAEAIKGYHVLVKKRTAQLVESLEKIRGRETDLSAWLNWLAHDIMSDMIFGSGPEMIHNQDFDHIWRLLDEAQAPGIVLSHLPWLGEFSLKIPFIARQLHEFRTYGNERILRRQQSGSRYKDLVYHLMDEEGEGVDTLSVEQLVNDSSLAIVAGSDTIATTLANVFWLLARHPVAYKRLQKEVDALDGKIDDVVELGKLPYLNAVINETLRLYPPVLSGSPRSPDRTIPGQNVGPHFLPRGTTAYVHLYTMQRSERYFSPFVDRFLPERWLPEDAQIALEPEVFLDRGRVVHDASAFIPFSYGPADCIGKRLAQQELRTVIVSIIRAFHVKLAPGYDPLQWEKDMKDYFITNRGKLPVVLTDRT